MFKLLLNDKEIKYQLEKEKTLTEFLKSFLPILTENKFIVMNMKVDNEFYNLKDEKLNTIMLEDIKSLAFQVGTPKEIVISNLSIIEHVYKSFELKINNIIEKFHKDMEINNEDDLLDLLEDFSAYNKMLKNTAEIITLENLDINEISMKIINHINDNNGKLKLLYDAIKNEDYQSATDILEYEILENLKKFNETTKDNLKNYENE